MSEFALPMRLYVRHISHIISIACHIFFSGCVRWQVNHLAHAEFGWASDLVVMASSLYSLLCLLIVDDFFI